MTYRFKDPAAGIKGILEKLNDTSLDYSTRRYICGELINLLPQHEEAVEAVLSTLESGDWDADVRKRAIIGLVKHVKPKSKFENNVIKHFEKLISKTELEYYRLLYLRTALKHAKKGSALHSSIEALLDKETPSKAEHIRETIRRRLPRFKILGSRISQDHEGRQNIHFVQVKDGKVVFDTDGTLKDQRAFAIYKIVADEVARFNPAWKINAFGIRSEFKPETARRSRYTVRHFFEFSILGDKQARSLKELPAPLRRTLNRKLKAYFAAENSTHG